jgi:hypothetical protein
MEASGCCTRLRNTDIYLQEMRKTDNARCIVSAGRDLNPERLFIGPPEALGKILLGVSKLQTHVNVFVIGWLNSFGSM